MQLWLRCSFQHHFEWHFCTTYEADSKTYRFSQNFFYTKHTFYNFVFIWCFIGFRFRDVRINSIVSVSSFTNFVLFFIPLCSDRWTFEFDVPLKCQYAIFISSTGGLKVQHFLSMPIREKEKTDVSRITSFCFE